MSFTASRLLAGLLLMSASMPALSAIDAIEEARTCREQGIAELGSTPVPSLPRPGDLGAILEIALPASVVTVRSAGGHSFRRTVWFILHLPSYQAVDVAWASMASVQATIAEGLAESSAEDMCTIARDDVVTLRLEQRVRDVLNAARAVLRMAISRAERID